jgi:hypothetical protein
MACLRDARLKNVMFAGLAVGSMMEVRLRNGLYIKGWHFHARIERVF